ncbi:hypothetical protein HGQ17_12775 [Nesterenkonia sp. MY13]|uniref:Glycerophosphoryl diester phosphodiesterase membrane domain-containing protein n=1 Tax=Nesterenkonia sedimenti TaxID=1463632 RepID=A0A7X8TL83_9MICC|nr:hypothetical protein [Nesterenkonia sedimenti]NLS10850.1 hypothetical protein [Nesterenkonia sedimenti]
MNSAAELRPAPTLRPGAVYPLRPLAQDETFSAAFAVIRHSPRAVLGLPFLAGLINVLTLLVLLAVLPSDAFLRMLADPLAFDNQELMLASLVDGWMIALLLLSSFIGWLIMLMSLGLLAIPGLRAAYGLPTSLLQTVTMRAGRLGWLLLHLVVVSLLLGLVGLVAMVIGALLIGLTMLVGAIVVLPAMFLLLCWVTAAFMFGPLVVVVERRNAFSALGRSFALNRGQWWRHIGAVALLYLMLGVVMTISSIPAGVIAGIGGDLAWQSAEGNEDLLVLAVLGFGQLYDAVLSALLVSLAGTVIAMMYLNSRFRREALDIDLARTAQQTEPAERILPGGS